MSRKPSGSTARGSKQKKKNRIPVISPHFGKHVEVEIGGLNLKDGIFTFKDLHGNAVVPKSVTIGDSYTKESGKPKILNQIGVDNSQINLNPTVALQSFDCLFVVDTNSRERAGSKIAISCSAFCQLDLKDYDSTKDTQDWDTKVIMLSAFIFRNPPTTTTTSPQSRP